MKTLSYDGFAYRQGAAPDTPMIVSFVAPAEEIIDWAGMPRRSEDDEMAGFQRVLDEARVERARDFFKTPLNQSPTAIVVGVHPTSSANPSAAQIELKGGKDDAVRPCTLTLTYPDRTDFATAIGFVRGLIDQRLGAADMAQEEELESAEKEEDEAGDIPQDEEEDATDDEEIELGRSLLIKLRKRLDEPDWCNRNQEALMDLAKPATVIDGQHRLKGAERCERRIPFTVCALVDCSWSEQVFQFTVINYTQHGIPDQFITSNAALSLTQLELGNLQNRLIQAGVKVVEYDLMKVVHFHDKSPFKDLVNLTARKDPAKIGYRTMVRLARAWFDARHPVFRTVLPALYPDLPHKRQHKERVSRWKREDWGYFFIDFWRVVHERYATRPSHVPGHRLWDVGHSQLIVAIVLFELQSAFLDSLNQQDEEYWKMSADRPESLRKDVLERVQRRAKKFVEWFEPEFFAAPWAHRSLSIGPGRKALSECFNQLVRTKGSFRYGNSALVTTPTPGS